MKSLLVTLCYLLIVQYAQGVSQDMLGPLDDYTFCQVVDDSEKFVLFWTVSPPNINFAIVGNSTGYVGLGFNFPSSSRSDKMTESDAIIGWVDSNNNTFVDDYYIGIAQASCDLANGLPGVCTDVESGGTKNINTVSGKQTGSVTELRFSRPMDSPDNNYDVDIDSSAKACIWSISKFDDVSLQHDFRGSFNLNFMVAPSCPIDPNNNQVCSGHGSCVKGCCICDTGFARRDCSLDLGFERISSLAPDIIETEYKFNKKISEDFTVFWKIFEESEQIEIAVRVKGSGWVAFGPSKNGQMPESDVMLGYVDGTDVVLADYFIDGRTSGCPGVCKDVNPLIGGKENLIDYNGRLKDGVTELKWIRPLKTGDSAGDIDIVSGEMNAIWGFHPTSQEVVKHLFSDRGSIKVDFFAGTVTQDNLFLVHGILMFIGWAVLIPAGSFIARFLKKFSWWFHVHRIFNGLAIAAVLASFIIAIVKSGEHFQKPHSIIGLIVVIVGFSQPIIGIVADRLFDPNRLEAPFFPDKLHWVLGWGSLLLAMINIFLGLLLWTDYGLLVGYGIYFAIVIAFLSGFMVYKGIVGIDDDH